MYWIYVLGLTSPSFVSYWQGKHNKAIPLLERALKIRIHTLGAWHKDTDNTQHALELARKKVRALKTTPVTLLLREN